MTEEDSRVEWLESFQGLSLQSYELASFRAYGERGLDALVTLLDAARHIFQHVPFEMMTDGVSITTVVSASYDVAQLPGMTIRSAEELAGRPMSSLAVVIVDGAYRVLAESVGDLFRISDQPSMTYRYIHGQTEIVVIDGQPWTVNDSSFPCAMATPTYSSLEDALDAYVLLNRQPDRCPHLAEAWRDPNRLAFGPRPEHHMRSSLLLALQYSMGTDVTVRPEQNQDATKPVDIEATWWSLKRSAIIEIKWLGCSGDPEAPDFSTPYTAARAVSGMRQLADYLDRRDKTTPDVAVMGYLVVFDARRRGLGADQEQITKADGLYYQDLDPDYPQELLDRADMGRPYRCFLEPIYSHG